MSSPHYLPHSFMSASEKCCLASEPYALRTVQCWHTALCTVVAVQHSDYRSDMHTAEHLQHTNNFTVTTGADIDRRPTGDLPHSTQFPVLTAVPQFSCTGIDSLLQRARFTETTLRTDFTPLPELMHRLRTDKRSNEKQESQK